MPPAGETLAKVTLAGHSLGALDSGFRKVDSRFGDFAKANSALLVELRVESSAFQSSECAFETLFRLDKVCKVNWCLAKFVS